MDSKRKANGTASAADEMDERGGKRRKLSVRTLISCCYRCCDVLVAVVVLVDGSW